MKQVIHTAFWGLVFLLLGLAGCASAIPNHVGDRPMVVIPSGGEMPELSADFSAAAWARAAVVGVDYALTGDAPRLETSVRTFCTGENLYVGFGCQETAKPLVTSEERDIWARDSVEILIEPQEDLVGRPYGHIIVDAAGKTLCARGHVYPRYFQLKAFEEDWRPAVSAVTAQDAQGWNCAVKIPLADLHLGDSARGGGVWRLNFCRTRPGREARESDAYWSWAPLPLGAFQTPTRLGYAIPAQLAGADLADRLAKIQAAHPGDASRDFAADPVVAGQVEKLFDDFLAGQAQASEQLRAWAFRGEAMQALVRRKAVAAAAEAAKNKNEHGGRNLRQFIYELARDGPDDDPLPASLLRQIERWRPGQVADADGHVMPYRLREPDAMAAGRRYPLVICLHGSAECGSDNRRQLFAATWNIPVS